MLSQLANHVIEARITPLLFVIKDISFALIFKQQVTCQRSQRPEVRTHGESDGNDTEWCAESYSCHWQAVVT